ncbi:hypothetical protein HDU93_000361 [Gonapodya sp. JEL0774]|nr:hypothetical protein HDU93_000361 [Gonapodya sp. JEL0774]
MSHSPSKSGSNYIKHIFPTGSTHYTVDHLSAGEWALRARGCNHIGLGPWSMPLHVFVEDPSIARDASKRAAEMERYEKRRKASDELELILRSVEDEGGRGSAGRIDERITELKAGIENAKWTGVDRDVIARAEEWIQTLTNNRSEKAEMAIWKDKLTLWQQTTLAEGDTSGLGIDFAVGIIDMPPAQELHASVRNMLQQHVNSVIANVGRLTVIVPGEISLTADQVAGLGRNRKHARLDTTSEAIIDIEAIIPKATLELIQNSEFVEYLPRWRMVHPHDRVRCVVAAAMKRMDLLEQDWRTVTSKKKLAEVQQQAELEARLAETREAKFKAQYGAIEPAKDDSEFDFDRERRMFAEAYGQAAGGNAAPTTSATQASRVQASPPAIVAPVPPPTRPLQVNPEVAAKLVQGHAAAVPAVAPPRIANGAANASLAQPKADPSANSSRGVGPQLHAVVMPPRQVAPHEVRRVIPCKFFSQNRNCYKGSKCNFYHMTGYDPTVEVGVWGGTKKCKKNEDGACARGAECQYADQHTWKKLPQPEPPAASSRTVSSGSTAVSRAVSSTSSWSSSATETAQQPAIARSSASEMMTPPRTASSVTMPAVAPPPAEWERVNTASLTSAPNIAAPLVFQAAPSPPTSAPTSPLPVQRGTAVSMIESQNVALPSPGLPTPPPPMPTASVESILVSLNLQQYVQLFAEQQIDLETLKLLEDQDFEAMGLVVGARVKLRQAIRKLNAMNAAQVSGSASDLIGSTGTPQIEVPRMPSPPTPPVEPELVEVPSTFKCPITHEIMKHPVVAPDGHTYEEVPIRTWIQHKHTSPITGLKFSGQVRLAPNYTLRSMIIDWTEKYKGRYRD